MTQPTFLISQVLLAARNGAANLWTTIVADALKAEQAIVKVLGPSVETMVAADVAAGKQFASDAITAADSWLSSHAVIVAQTVETTIDTELALATNGVSTGYNKLTNQGVDVIVNAAIAAAHNMGIAIKAKLAASSMGSVVPVSQAPPVQVSVASFSQEALKATPPQLTKPSGE